MYNITNCFVFKKLSFKSKEFARLKFQIELLFNYKLKETKLQKLKKQSSTALHIKKNENH